MAEEFVRVRCTSCSALVRIPRVTGSHPCSECGAMLAVKLKEQPTQAPKPEPPRAVKEATVERIEASRDVTRAAERLRSLRWLYAIGVVYNALVVMSQIGDLAEGTSPLMEDLIGICLVTVSLVLQIGAATLLLQQPVLWSTLVAVWISLFVLAAVLGGALQDVPRVFYLFMSFMFVWVLLMWWIVFLAVRLARLMRESPDSYAVQSLLGAPRMRRSEGTSPEEWEQRRTQVVESARRSARLRVGMTSAVVVSIIAGASFLVITNLRPPSFENAVDRFLHAWELEDPVLIGGMATAKHREAIQRRLANAPETREWTAGWPELVESDRQVGEAVAKVFYFEAAEQIRVDWALADRRWSLTGIDLPYPILDDSVEQFLGAWEESDAKAVAALFAPESRAKIEASLLRHVERHGWQKDFPTLEILEARPVSDSRVEVSFLYDGGMLDVRWKLDPDDRWVLSGIAWPKGE